MEQGERITKTKLGEMMNFCSELEKKRKEKLKFSLRVLESLDT